jgi:serine/threonine protein kinase
VNRLAERANGRLGQTLKGKYRIDRVLGVGGMAVVYVATHRNQKQFAVKMLHPELSAREEIRQRFLREGYAANSVKHPGAVAVLDDDTAEDGAAFLVMELLDGAPVEALWEKQRSRMAAAHVLAIGYHVLDVLAAAHAKGIIHRDIKPANLFLTQDGQLKVLDFGIARVRDLASNDASATGTGVVLGTPAFMSPEQAVAKPGEVDARTDVWAVGATMFTLFAGRNVHEAETLPQLYVKLATTQASPLRDVVPDAPEPLATVVDRALLLDPNARWKNAEEMRDACRDAHLAVSGRVVSRESLLGILGAGTAGQALELTERSEPPLAEAGSGSAPLPAVSLGDRKAPGAEAIPPRLGGTTAPTSRASLVTGEQPTRPGRGLYVGATAAALAAVILVALYQWGQGAGPRGLVTTPTSLPPATSLEEPTYVAVPPPTDPPRVDPPRVDPPKLVAPSPSAVEAPSSAPSSSPPELAKTLPAAAATRSASATPKTNPNCAKKFTVDLQGHRIFKPECFEGDQAPR